MDALIEFLVRAPVLAIVLILAIVICGAELIKAINVWKAKKKEDVSKAVAENQESRDLQDTLTKINDTLEKMNGRMDGFEKKQASFDTKLEILTTSDMHDTKGWIVEQYYKFYVHQGWIDEYNMEVIERRFEDYEREGGNSYIRTLVERIWSLPRRAPDNN